MLEHEPRESVQPPAVGQRRVTAEEFSRAVSAIEERKAEQARQLAGTLSIEQGIQELELDATPAEVWAEVEAERARLQARNPSPTGARRPSLYRLGLVIVIAIWVFGHARHATIPPRPLPPSPLIPAPPGQSQEDAGETTAPLTLTLAEVEPGRSVYGSTGAIRQIIRGVPADRIVVHDEEVTDGWPLVKFGDHVYLRGYSLSQSSGVIRAVGLHLYNDDDAGELEGRDIRPVTVRLDSLRLDKVQGGIRHGQTPWTEIVASDVRLDSHAFESW